MAFVNRDGGGEFRDGEQPDSLARGLSYYRRSPSRAWPANAAVWVESQPPPHYISQQLQRPDDTRETLNFETHVEGQLHPSVLEVVLNLSPRGETAWKESSVFQECLALIGASPVPPPPDPDPS